MNTVDNYNGKIQELTEKLALTTDPEVKARIQTQLSGLTGHRADDFVSVMLGKGKGHII